jgi:hypothetical protein
VSNNGCDISRAVQGTTRCKPQEGVGVGIRLCALCSCPKGPGDKWSQHSKEPSSSCWSGRMSLNYSDQEQAEESSSANCQHVDYINLVLEACCRSCRSQILGPIQRSLSLQMCSDPAVEKAAAVERFRQLTSSFIYILPKCVRSKCSPFS